MFRSIVAALCVGLLPSVATAQVEFQMRESANFPCLMGTSSPAGEVSFQLSDYRDRWALNMFISGVAQELAPFFDEDGTQDYTELRRALDEISVDGEVFPVQTVSLFAVRQSDLDEDSQLIISIAGRHNVLRALEAVDDGRISIGEDLVFHGYGPSLRTYRACVFDELDHEAGAPIETDFRLEYQLVYERSFPAWVEIMTEASRCGGSLNPDGEIQASIEAAAAAFLPGIMSFSARRDFIEFLEGEASIARLRGATNAMNGCTPGVSSVARAMSTVMERAIAQAGDL